MILEITEVKAILVKLDFLDNSNIILSGIFTNFKNKATSERENSLSSIFKDLGRDYQIDASKLDTGNFGSFLGKEEIQFEAGDEIEQKASL